MKPSIFWLFVFIPVTLILEHAGKVPPPVIFFSAALAIIPIAALIVLSTEQLATRTGRKVSSRQHDGDVARGFGSPHAPRVPVRSRQPGGSAVPAVLRRSAAGSGGARSRIRRVSAGR